MFLSEIIVELNLLQLNCLGFFFWGGGGAEKIKSKECSAVIAVYFNRLHSCVYCKNEKGPMGLDYLISLGTGQTSGE